MRLSQLQYFQVLARVLHYTKASQELHISQPNLSYAIAELEKELDVSLFSKDKKKIKLSPYGEIFLNYVNQSMENLDKGVKVVRSVKNSSVGVVNIGYLYSISATVVPKIVDAFKKTDSDKIKFRFMQNVQAGMVRALQSGRMDFALSAGTDPSMVSVPLIEQELFALVSDKNPLAKKACVTFEEIAHEPFIAIDTDSALWQLIDDHFKKLDATPNIVGEARECAAALEYVARDEGITIIPDTPEAKALPVTKVRITTPGFTRHIYLSWNNNYIFTPTSKNVRDRILKLFLTSAEIPSF